jgi:hypothetical protein
MRVSLDEFLPSSAKRCIAFTLLAASVMTDQTRFIARNKAAGGLVKVRADCVPCATGRTRIANPGILPIVRQAGCPSVST